jgi:hypothetical protein
MLHLSQRRSLVAQRKKKQRSKLIIVYWRDSLNRMVLNSKMDLINNFRIWLKFELMGTRYSNDVDNIIDEIIQNAYNIDDDVLEYYEENLGYIIDNFTSYNYEQMKKQIRLDQRIESIDKDFK